MIQRLLCVLNFCTMIPTILINILIGLIVWFGLSSIAVIAIWISLLDLFIWIFARRYWYIISNTFGRAIKSIDHFHDLYWNDYYIPIGWSKLFKSMQS